jgi:uncharacterized protein YqgC (DUF456 family)
MILVSVLVDIVHDHLVIGILLVPLIFVAVQEVIAQRNQDNVVRKQ